MVGPPLAQCWTWCTSTKCRFSQPGNDCDERLGLRGPAGHARLRGTALALPEAVARRLQCLHEQRAVPGREPPADLEGPVGVPSFSALATLVSPRTSRKKAAWITGSSGSRRATRTCSRAARGVSAQRQVEELRAGADPGLGEAAAAVELTRDLEPAAGTRVEARGERRQPRLELIERKLRRLDHCLRCHI